MKKLFYLPLMLALSFISCKKENPQTYDPQEQSNNNLTNKKTVSSMNGREGSGIVLNLKVYLQGYYVSERYMQPVLENQGIKALPNETDSILVELRDPGTGRIVNLMKTIIYIDGQIKASFDAPEGKYFIVVKHRNSIETWSAEPVYCYNNSTTNYDFSKSNIQAFRGNMVEVEQGIWALYTGDINQDGLINENDFALFNEDSNSGVSGVYVATDLNGDGFVDGNDFPILDNNMYLKIHSMNPFN